MEKQKVRMINTNPKSRFFNKVRPFSEGFAKSSYAKSEGWVIQELPAQRSFSGERAPGNAEAYKAIKEHLEKTPPVNYPEAEETLETSSEEVGYATKEQVEKLSSLPEPAPGSQFLTHSESNPVKAYADKAIEIGIAGKPTPEPKRRGRKPDPDKAVTKSKKK